jgi:hypothetical protein
MNERVAVRNICFRYSLLTAFLILPAADNATVFPANYALVNYSGMIISSIAVFRKAGEDRIIALLI